jgi:hypothetical protein
MEGLFQRLFKPLFQHQVKIPHTDVAANREGGSEA